MKELWFVRITRTEDLYFFNRKNAVICYSNCGTPSFADTKSTACTWSILYCSPAYQRGGCLPL